MPRLHQEQQLDHVLMIPHETPFQIKDVLNGDVDKGLKYVWEYARLAAAIYNKNSLIFSSHRWHPCSTEFQVEANNSIRLPSGLKVQAWRKTSSDNRYIFVAIVFRGTSKDAFLNDWLYGNFYWATRLLPFTQTYYEQVINNIERFVQRVKEEVANTSSLEIVVISAGHSLGGGLAQCAAYSVEDIKLCYAFDATPVTGYYSLDKYRRAKSCENLSIYRVYEDREILRYVREFTQRTYKLFKRLANLHPRFVESRFNLIKDRSYISNHSINKLANGLERIAREHGLIDSLEPVMRDDEINTVQDSVADDHQSTSN